jgi:hypothetical protein
VVEALQDLDAPTRSGQIRRSHQAVVPATDDDDIESRRPVGPGAAVGGAQFR